jgi:hypothetical protein
MANFDSILAGIHAGAVKIEDKDAVITISDKRTFEVASDYNTVLAYAGDVNSQIVTFEIPESHEGHDLSQCDYKKLKWKNKGSGAEGVSDLIPDSTNKRKLKWEVPPAAMTQAGALEIAISIYDIDDSGRVAFSWNTAPYAGFSIGVSFTDIGTAWENEELPAKNEILVINTEDRTIVAPVDYDTLIANFGDKGTSKVYFSIDRNARGIDLLNENALINVNAIFGGDISAKYPIQNTTDNKPIKAMPDNEEQLLITWEVPDAITNNSAYYTGNIAIALSLELGDKRWTTSVFSKLQIGASLLLSDISGITERNEEIVGEAIDEYMHKHFFVIQG